MSSRYWRDSWPSKIPPLSDASRAVFSINPMNSASNCTAASARAPGSSRAARCRRSVRPCRSTDEGIGDGVVMLDHDQLGAQRACFPQRFENRDEVARCGPDAINGLDDVVQARAGLEQKHSTLSLIHVDVRLRND